MLLMLLGCRENSQDQLTREDLFTLSYGRLEDQIDMTGVTTVREKIKYRLYSRDGLFYIADGKSRKLMVFSSFGDILRLYYNQELNPVPITLNTDEEKRGETNKNAYGYPFGGVGEFLVTPEGDMLIEHVLPSSRQIEDKELQTTLRNNFIRMNSGGELEYTLGRDGIDGSPFGYINSLHMINEQDILVISRTDSWWTARRFDHTGGLLWEHSFSSDTLPKDEEIDQYNIKEIKPDTTTGMLFLHVDCYQNLREEAPGRGVSYLKSRVINFNPETERYVNQFDLPLYDQLSRDHRDFGEDKKAAVDYSFLGVAADSVLLLLVPLEGQHNVLYFYDRSGQMLAAKDIYLPEEKIYYCRYHITPEGILTALVGKEFSASVFWWRTDLLIRKYHETTR